MVASKVNKTHLISLAIGADFFALFKIDDSLLK